MACGERLQMSLLWLSREAAIEIKTVDGKEIKMRRYEQQDPFLQCAVVSQSSLLQIENFAPSSHRQLRWRCQSTWAVAFRLDSSKI